jgi:hypothetical protein
MYIIFFVIPPSTINDCPVINPLFSFDAKNKTNSAISCTSPTLPKIIINNLLDVGYDQMDLVKTH